MATITLESLGPDDTKNPVTCKKEEKYDHCYTYHVLNEDHTLGNILANQLSSESHIIFAGYRIEHPTKDSVIIRAQSEQPVNSAHELIAPSIRNLRAKLDLLSESFRRSSEEYDRNQES